MEPIWGSPALEIKVDGGRWIIIADLHLGFELEFAKQGVYIPDRTDYLAEKLLSLDKADGLLIAGDLKHSIGLSAGLRVKRFIQRIASVFPKILLTVGNHDGGITSLVGEYCEVRGSKGVSLDDAWVFHGHATPPPEASELEFGVMGHVHPSISIRGMGRIPVWLLAETTCDFLPPSLVIVPAFNEMLGYGDLLRVRERGPIFPKCIDPESTDVLTLDGHYLGTLAYLSKEKDLLSLT